MRRRGLLVLGLLACLASEPSGAASEESPKPFLWVVEGDTPVYMVGTFHAFDDRLTNLPKLVRDAAAASDVLLREVPNDTETGRKLNELIVPKDGKTVDQRLAPELYARLMKVMPLPEAGWKDLNLLGVLMLLGIREQFDGMRQGKKNMDARIEALFTDAQKPVEALETVEELTASGVSLSAEERVKRVAETVKQIEQMEREGRSPLRETLAAYLSGDLEKFVKKLDEGFDPKDALQVRLRKLDNDDRNARIVERLLAKTKANPRTSYFVMVGAGHFPRDGAAGAPGRQGEEGASVEARRRTAREEVAAWCVRRPDPVP